jgi:HlyD family secretion protein
MNAEFAGHDKRNLGQCLRRAAPGFIIIRMINNLRRWVALLLWPSITMLCACNPAQAGNPESPDPLQGVVEHDDRVIGFELGGRVLEVPVQRGQQVTADVLLARLDPGLELPVRDLRAAELAAAEAQLRLLRAGARGEEIRASEAEVAALRAQEGILEKNLARQQTLVSQSALAQSVVDDTSASLQGTGDRRRALEERLKALRSGARGDEIAAAVARVAAASAALAGEVARLSRFELHSPAAGSITDVHVEVGEMVATASPVVTLADLAHPYVDVFVPEGRAHALAVGQAMQVRVDGIGRALRGQIEHVFPKTEFTPRFLFSEGERPNLVIRMRVRVDDPQHELHGGVPAFVQPLTAASSEKESVP